MKKQIRHTIYINDIDYKRLKKLALKRNESQSAVIRKLIAIEKYAKTLEQIEIHNKINAEILYQLTKYGSNLNQIAYHLNIGYANKEEAKNNITKIFDSFSKNIKEHKENIKQQNIDLKIKTKTPPKREDDE